MNFLATGGYIRRRQPARQPSHQGCHKQDLIQNAGREIHHIHRFTPASRVADPARETRFTRVLVKHERYYWLMLAESHLTRRLFGRW